MRNDRTEYNNKAANILSRSGRMVKPRVFKDGTTAAESPKHSSAEDDLSPVALDVKERLEGSEGSKSARDSRSSNGSLHGLGKRRTCLPKRTSGGGGIFKQAAVQVLREEQRLMSTGEITKLALQRGYVSRSGKTPEATMASALYTDLKRRSGETVFIRPKEGLFGLKEWDEKHGYGEVQVEPAESSGPKYSPGGVGQVGGHGARAWPEPAERASQPSRLRMQAPADTTGSQCVAYRRDGLIELLSAAERVNGVGVNASVQPEKGSIPDPMRQDSAEMNNANGDLDRDHCVQSPRTRALSGMVPVSIEREKVGTQDSRVDAVITVSKMLSQILDCVNICPDEIARARALNALIEIEQVLASRLLPR